MLRVLDWLHRWTGGLIGLVLALLGLSGTILLYEANWIRLPHAHDTQVQETAAIVAAVEAMMAHPADRPRSVTFASTDFGLNQMNFGDGKGAYADQMGDVVTRWSSSWERPELWLFDFHHHLFAGETGEVVIGIAGLCGLFFVVSGTLLWWRTRRTFRFRLWPRRLSRPMIVWQHRDLGIIAAPLLLLSLFTGATMIFRPLSALVIGPSGPARVEQAFKPPGKRQATLADRPDWRGMIETARDRFPNGEFRVLSLPRGDNGLILIRMKQPAEWLPNGRTLLWFAADTGELVDARDALAMPGPVQTYNMLYPLHAAKVGGVVWKGAMTLSGLALTMLGSLAVWTFWLKGGRRLPGRLR